MNKRLGCVAALLIALFSPAWCQDLVAIAPQVTKVEYEDARVRVVRLKVPPNTSIPTHDRPRRVVIPLTTSVVRMSRANGTTSNVRSVAGTAAWSEPGRRSYTNLDQPLENIVVELEQAEAPGKPLPHPPEPPPANYLTERFHHWLFENQYVRVYDVRIPPGETTDFHLHALDMVAVTIAGDATSAQPQGKEWSKPEKVQPGAVSFSADAQHPRTHRVRNEGPGEYHVILVQFLQ